MQPGNTDILFAGTLLGFDEPSGSINADNEVASDFRVESTAVTGFLDLEDPFDPSNDLMRRRVSGFIKVNNTVLDVLVERALER